MARAGAGAGALPVKRRQRRQQRASVITSAARRGSAAGLAAWAAHGPPTDLELERRQAELESEFVGRAVRKVFPRTARNGFEGGTFRGRVESVLPLQQNLQKAGGFRSSGSSSSWYARVRYEDNEVEDMSERELCRLLSDSLNTSRH
jgi:hypothetical protein